MGAQQISSAGGEINAPKRKWWVIPRKQITPVYQNVILEATKLLPLHMLTNAGGQVWLKMGYRSTCALLLEPFSGGSFWNTVFSVKRMSNREYPFPNPNVICLCQNEIIVMVLLVNINEWLVAVLQPWGFFSFILSMGCFQALTWLNKVSAFGILLYFEFIFCIFSTRKDLCGSAPKCHKIEIIAW